jgi:hypothetical protein
MLHDGGHAIRDLVCLRNELQLAMTEVQKWENTMFEERTKQAQVMLQGALERGSHGDATLALLGVIADASARASGSVADRLIPYLERVEYALGEVARAGQLDVPPSTEVPATRKRRLQTMEALGCARPAAQQGIIAMLRDTTSTLPNLTASEHRLLSTVITTQSPRRRRGAWH